MHRVYTEYSYPVQAILCWTLCTHGGTEIILTTIHRACIWTMHRVYTEYSYPAQAILCWTLCTHGGTEIILHRVVLMEVQRLY